MDRAYIAACAEFSLSHRDWNAEFQMIYELEEETAAQARRRQEEIYRIEMEFETDAVTSVKKIVTLDDNGPRELPKFLHCYRVDNIFFRVLPDSRSGRNYVASLRGVLQSRTRLLTVPLSCMFFYRGMPVLAQALVPMPPQPTRLYGAGSTDDPEVEAEIALMAEALNIPLPEKIICDVYASLDARLYCLSTNVSTIPVSDRLPMDCPIKRQEMLIFCARVMSGPEDVFAVLRAPLVLDALANLHHVTSPTNAQMRLCDTLHFYGVNLCFLKEVVTAFKVQRGSDASALETLESCVMVEMFARTIKQEFYLSVQSKRIAFDDVALGNMIATHIRHAFHSKEYHSIFLTVLMRKYFIRAEEKEFIHHLDRTRRARRHDIIARVSVLIGARTPSQNRRASSNTSVDTTTTTTTTTSATTAPLSMEAIVWLPTVESRVFPRLLDPNMSIALATQFAETHTTEGHTFAFCLPLRARVAVWDGALEEALRLTRLTAQSHRSRYGVESFAHLYALRAECALLFALGRAKEGVPALGPLLRGFASAAVSTRVRRHTEAGCWVLRAGAHAAEGALAHFATAAALASGELRAAHSAWLYVMPRLGILRCVQSGATCPPDARVEALGEDAIEMAKRVAPADYFVEFLWEIGMELKRDRLYAAAAEALRVALGMGRKVPNTELDLGALTRDLIYVYRAWDPKKYATYCDALLKGAQTRQERT